MDAKTKTFIRNYTTALKEHNAAIFAGAGLSKASGFVDWKGLLRHIAEDLHLDIDKEQDLVALTQFHINEKGGNRSSLNQTLVEEFTKDSTKTRNHRILAALPIGIYWTTNYDTLIEDALRDAGKTPDVKITHENLAVCRPRRDAIVYKMHGDIAQPENVVVSKDDYEAYNLRRPLFATALQGDLVSKTFLFIGFSFDDPNLNHILGRIRVLLGENQREHFCFFRRVSRQDYDSDADYEYGKIKQELRINDLKRYSIDGILVDDYPQITEILARIQDSFNRNTVFISGSADDYGAWEANSALNFIHTLAYKLLENDFKIVSGFGLGIGSTVINGCLEYVNSTNYRHLDEYLSMRPFPQVITGSKSKEELWKEYRKDMISNAGSSLFLFGNKKGPNGTIDEADGVFQEFEIAKQIGLKLVPVGATGFVAKKLWKQVIAEFDSLYPDYSHLRKDFEFLGNEGESHETLVATIVRILNAIRGD